MNVKLGDFCNAVYEIFWLSYHDKKVNSEVRLQNLLGFAKDVSQ